jgi:hypothetical protein
MSEEDFLTRWSRRKREADLARSEQPETKTEDAAKAEPESGVDAKADAGKPAEFDPATLPPLESINALSDITAFLRAGVPAELTRAALRRVWTVDPSIRDFVGLAENAWDFTDPNAMPGFGPLEDTEEVRRMIAKVVDSIGGQAKKAVTESAPETPEIAQDANDSSQIGSDRRDQASPQASPRGASGADLTEENPAQNLDSQVLLQSNTDDGAMQDDVTEIVEKPKQIVRRIHGGALPE